MAYDSLKALIRQYIKTNGEQEITGQILQNVLVEMVNQYPSTDGYATQSWVTSQGYLIPGSRISLLGNDVGYLTSADLSGYATTSQLAGYLPLTGGTMTGDINMANCKLIFGTPYIYGSTIPGPQGTNMGHILNFDGVDGYGYYDFDNSVHATSFVKSGGTSAQFLKADGSVDSNTYLIPGSSISLLGNDVGYLTSADLSGYATTSQLAGYLPLTGGTLTGDLNMAYSSKLIFGTPYIYGSTIPGPQGTNMGHILNFDGVDGYGYYNFDNSVHATSFVKSSGTSAQFLKADGSVDSNTYLIPGSSISLLGNDVGYLTSADLSGYATTSQLAGYLPLTGGTLTGDLNMANCKLNFGTAYIQQYTIPGPQGTNMGHILEFEGVDGYGYYDFDNSVHATSFVKSGGTSAQFLKADGSVDSNAYITLASVKGNLSVWNNTAMTWGTLTAANGYTIGVHASSSDGGDCGMCYKSGQISMQLDGWYYQNEGRYRVVDTSDLASYNPTTNFKTINNQSIIGTGNINIEGGGGGAYYDAEIAYLQSTGTQYIKVPRITGQILEFEITYTAIQLTSYGRCWIFGSWDEGSGGTNGFSLDHYSKIRLLYSTTYPNFFVNWFEFQTGASLNTEYTIKINGNSLYVNNVVMPNPDVPYYITEGRLIYLFGVSISEQELLLSPQRINRFYLKTTNGTIDLIPVRVGNVGYMYDKVSGQLFGNSGTGDFVLGQDTGPGGGLPYLPLTGGTITGNLTVNGNNGINFGTDDDVYIKREYSRLLIINEAGNDIIIGDYDNRKFTSIVNDLQGGTTDSTYRSVTQKWLIRHDGDAYFKSVSQTSDLNKKTIIGDVPINLYNVANAPLFKFTWNNETKYSGQHIGSAAQYWQTVLPELVSIGRDADMTLAMQYDVIALASAITVAKTVVNHEERIILLERENEALRQEIADLKSA